MPIAYVCSFGHVYDDGTAVSGGPYEGGDWEDTDDADLEAWLTAKTNPFFGDVEVDRTAGVVLRWQRYLLAVDPDTGVATYEPYGDPGEVEIADGDVITHRLRDPFSAAATPAPGVLDLDATGHCLSDRFGRPLTLADMSGTAGSPPTTGYVHAAVTIAGSHTAGTEDYPVTWDEAATATPSGITVGPLSSPFWASRVSGALLAGTATTTGATIRVTFSAPVAVDPPATMDVNGSYTL